MDFTPQLSNLRHNAQLAESLLGSSQLVLCLGSLALLFLT